MSLCATHNQWYVNYCVYCGEPGKSKMHDLQTVEPITIKLSKEAWEHLEEAFGKAPDPSVIDRLKTLFKNSGVDKNDS